MSKELTINNNFEIALTEGKSISTIFADNLVDDVIKAIEKKVEEFEPDITTKEGRAKIRSFAHDISKTKVALDKAGFGVTEEAREKVNSINADRKKIKDLCNSLRDKVKKPLTEYEEAEKLRIKAREDRLLLIKDMKQVNGSGTKYFQSKLSELASYLVKENEEKFDWMEFKAKAKEEINNTRDFLQESFSNAEKIEEAERVIEAERVRKENEAKAIREAEIAEAARKEALREAAALAEKVLQQAEQDKKDAKDAADKKEQDAKDAIAAKEKARVDAVAAADKAKADAIMAAHKAKADADAVVETERLRVAKEESDRMERKGHVEKINNESIECLVSCGLSYDDAALAVENIASGDVKNISINY